MIFNENEKIELKRRVDKDFARKVVAFLNTEGGTIYIGIDDKSRLPIGIENIDEEMKKISNAINDQIYPSAMRLSTIKTIKQGDKDIIKVDIKKSNTLHHLKSFGLTPKGTPVRFGTELRDMSEHEIAVRSLALLQNKLGITKIPANNQNLEFKTLKYLFFEKGLTINDEQFEDNIPGLKLEDGSYSMMAEMLSDINNIQILVVVFQGTDKTVFSRRTPFGGTCLIDTYKKVLDYCQNVINDVITAKHDESLTTIGRYDVRRFDNEAFEEAWLNAVTYNDWVTQNPPIIYVFDNRIEIQSVGNLPEGLSVEGFFKGRSRYRTKELFDLFDRLGLGDHTGHGVPLILSKYNNDKSIFEINEDSVTVTFKYPEIVTKELEINRIKLSDDTLKVEIYDELNISNNARKIIAIIKGNSSATASEMAKLINTTTRTVDRAIKELRDNNIIIREGSLKSGYWKILK